MSVAIIGCGSSGSAIAAQLARGKFFSKIKLIDLDVRKTKKLEVLLKKINKNINYLTLNLDATNIKSIKENLSQVDVLINAASPICNIPLMHACLKSRTNYVDLASDPFCYEGIGNETTLDEQLKLNNMFIKKDLVAVTNTGFSPGFTDVLCKHVVDKYSLNFINYFKVYIAELIESDIFVVSWSPYIFLLETISQSTVYEKGKIVYLDSQQNTKTITFPRPIGKIHIRPFNGHPELRTIPEFIRIPINYLEISGGMRLNNMQINDIIVEALRRKVKESVIFKGDILEILSKSFPNPDTFAENYKKGLIKKELACCRIEIMGRKKDKRILKYRVEIEHDIKNEIKKIPTSVSSFFVSFIPSIIAKKIGDGTISERGVIAPAALSVASDIIYECKEMGMNIKEYCN